VLRDGVKATDEPRHVTGLAVPQGLIDMTRDLQRLGMLRYHLCGKGGIVPRQDLQESFFRDVVRPNAPRQLLSRSAPVLRRSETDPKGTMPA
jgi:hypothetical protein